VISEDKTKNPEKLSTPEAKRKKIHSPDRPGSVMMPFRFWTSSFGSELFWF
jgi:hypothetical protein